jgi:Na+-driven multidrug efflux pump
VNCAYPNHARTSVIQSVPRRNRPFQFHFSTLLICMAISAVAFSLIGRFGFEGFWERLIAALEIGAIFASLIELCHWWKRSGYDA